MKWVSVALLVLAVIIVAGFIVYKNNKQKALADAQIQQIESGQQQLADYYSQTSTGGWAYGCNPFEPNTHCGAGKILFQIDSSILGGIV